MATLTLPVDNYIISRNVDEAQRLNLQHECIMACQGYYIHPTIPLPLGRARVAEICTGTAIWLCEVALANPSTECHGFDISNTMFPDQHSLPSNVQLHVADAKQAFAKQWLEYFDIVHIRLIQAAMKKEEWGSMLQNITTLMRPGGWLQWFEDDRAIAVRHAFRPAAPSNAAPDSLLATLSQPRWKPPHMYELARFNRLIMPDDRAEAMNYGYMNLDALMSDPMVGNLESVSCDGFAIDRQDDQGKLRRDWAKMGMSAAWNMVKIREDLGAEIADVSQDEWTEKVLGEIEAGGHWISRAIVFIGRKRL